MSWGRVLRLALVVPVLLVMCSCSSDGDDGGASSLGASCQAAFSPEKVARGDNCETVVGTYCPQSGNLLTVEPAACDGVVVEKRSVTAGGLTSEFLVIRPQGVATQESIYLALHYLAARTGAFANVVRLSELALARNVMVLVPQAPSSLLDSTLTSRWPTSTLEPVDSYVALLDQVVAAGRAEFGNAGQPLYVSGLSNGAAMVYFYGCRAAGRVEAIQAVAGGFTNEMRDACAPSRPIGTVIVHGTSDPLLSYNGSLTAPSLPEVHEFFEDINGCASLGTRATIAASSTDAIAVHIDYSQLPCSNGRRNYLVSLVGGGHNWPGRQQDDVLGNVGLLGAQTANFDATLQAYDLLKLAAAR